MRRVPYHQNVFDLLDMEPRESPQAREMIEAHEAQNGRLPEAVRQWYLTEGVVPLHHDANPDTQAESPRGNLWHGYRNTARPESLEMVLRQFAGERLAMHERVEGRPAGAVQVLTLIQGHRWYVQADGSDDPPLLADEAYVRAAMSELPWVKVWDRFSDFVFDWFVFCTDQEWLPSGPYRNGLWLYAPHAEPLAPPYLDFLIEQLNEDYRRQMAGGAMQYGFSHANGKIRVITDDPGEEGGVAAWWLHADSAEDLFRLAERVLWCGNLQEALRCQGNAAWPVMKRLRGRG